MTTVNGEAPADWIPSLDDFGSRLALVRHRMGWNIKEAARECGLPAASWRLWEVDGGMPRNVVTIAMGIANKTGCDYLWLVHGPDRGSRIRTTAYPPTTVLAAVGTPRPPRQRQRPTIHMDSGRPVRQTRPIGSGSMRPHTPVSV